MILIQWINNLLEPELLLPDSLNTVWVAASYKNTLADFDPEHGLDYIESFHRAAL